MFDAANKISILALGILFGVTVWVGSAAYDCYILHLGTFLACLIAAPEPTFAARVAAVIAGVSVGVGGQVFANRMLAHQRMKALFEHSNDGQVLLDPATGKILEVNARVVDFLGYERSEILKMTLADFHPHDLVAATAFIERVLCDGTGVDDRVSCRRKDGSLMPAEVSARAFQEGRRQYVIVSMRNISKRVLAQQEREAALQEVQIANRAKSDFLAVMSHELRTPLNAILGFSEMISRELLGPISVPSYREYAGHINEAGRHLFGIISDILMLTRIERGREPFEPARVNLRKCCENVVTMLSSFAEDSGVSLFLEFPEGIADAWADERKIKQILTNLISNSVKATPRGGRILIRYDFSASVGHIIRVEDSGVGMTEEQIRRSYEPFMAVNGSSPLKRGVSQSGIGLGLPLSRKLAEMHGGRIEIESRLAKGTRVSVIIPDKISLPKVQKDAHLIEAS